MKITITVNTEKNEYEWDTEVDSLDEALKNINDNYLSWTSCVMVVTNDSRSS